MGFSTKSEFGNTYTSDTQCYNITVGDDYLLVHTDYLVTLCSELWILCVIS